VRPRAVILILRRNRTGNLSYFPVTPVLPVERIGDVFYAASAGVRSHVDANPEARGLLRIRVSQLDLSIDTGCRFSFTVALALRVQDSTEREREREREREGGGGGEGREAPANRRSSGNC